MSMDVENSHDYLAGFAEGKMQLAANPNISLGYACHCANYHGFTAEFRRGFMDALSLKFGTEIYIKRDWIW